MKKRLIISSVAILMTMAMACKKEVEPEVVPNLVGKWTIKTAKNFSASTLTAKANATIDFTSTRYTVSQTQPFANYKNNSGVTEYLRIRNSTYKVMAIDEVLPLIEADLKLIFGNNYATALKNVTAMLNLYKNSGVKYVATLDDAVFVASDPSFGTITVDVPAFGIVNFTANGFALETLDFFGTNQDINKTTFVAKLPTLRGQILLEK
jgi:hypothetical protein